MPSLIAATLFQPVTREAVGVASSATLTFAVSPSVACTVTSLVVVSSPSVAVSRSTYVPSAVNCTTVVADDGLAKIASPSCGAETTDQAEVRSSDGWPSSETVPTTRACDGCANVVSRYALTCGAAFVDAGASAPVERTWISLRPVRAPDACLTVSRTLPVVTSGKRTTLPLAVT